MIALLFILFLLGSVVGWFLRPKSQLQWLDMKDAPRDGTEIIILTTTGIVSGYYHQWEEQESCEIPQRYMVAEWCCYDTAIKLEIEFSPDESSEALGWVPFDAITLRTEHA